jgi:outer membrane lipase/esterase
MKIKRFSHYFILLLFSLLVPGMAVADEPVNGLVIFGDSISDTGNKYFTTGFANTPPYSELLESMLVSDGPYTRGGLNHSNGATWIEQYARPRGLAGYVGPALRSDGIASNYAYGGARARLEPVIIENENRHLPTQVGDFLADVNYNAPADHMYVIFIGSNDIFDALIALLHDESGFTSDMVIAEAVKSVVEQIDELAMYGAQDFVILNAPDIGLTPVARLVDEAYSPVPGFLIGAASYYSQVYNGGLHYFFDNVPGIRLLNFYTAFEHVIENPADYGLTNTTDVCVMPEQPPYACRKPDEYVFWDGIHPTRVSHGILAEFFAEELGN